MHDRGVVVRRDNASRDETGIIGIIKRLKDGTMSSDLNSDNKTYLQSEGSEWKMSQLIQFYTMSNDKAAGVSMIWFKVKLSAGLELRQGEYQARTRGQERRKALESNVEPSSWAAERFRSSLDYETEESSIGNQEKGGMSAHMHTVCCR